MNMRAMTMLLFALLAAVGAVVAASKWLQTRSMQTEKVVVMISPLNMGEKINVGMLKRIDWPKTSLPEGFFGDIEKLDGRVVKYSLQHGEPVLESKLAPVGSRGGLSAVIAEGKRAITVKVNEVVGVAGFALPGNYVDIIVNTNQAEQSGSEDNISKIVLKHILVLAVGDDVNADADKPKVVNAVTLEVTPEQAEMIDLARSVGNLSLVLRNQSDPGDIATQGITKEALLSMVPKNAGPMMPVISKPRAKKTIVAAVAPVVVTKKCTKVFTGTTESLECF